MSTASSRGKKEEKKSFEDDEIETGANGSKGKKGERKIRLSSFA